MIYGVQIDDKNTLTDWGMILLQDLNIGEAKAKTQYIDVPEADGALDLTNALTPVPVYEMRQISFSLFAGKQPGGQGGPQTEHDFARTRAALSGYCSGKKRRVWFPDDPEHYFLGRLQVGGKSGYNSGQVTVTMQAEPWRYRTEKTVRTFTAPGTYYLDNEERRAPVTITASAVCTITHNGTEYQVAPGVTAPGLVLDAGTNEITITGQATLAISYQEGHL